MNIVPLLVVVVALVLVGVVVALLVRAARGPRPDRPSAGTDDSPVTRGGADDGAEDGARRTNDRPGDAGLEGMNPAEPGDPSAGPIADGERDA